MYDAHENFIAYQEEIVSSPVYEGMPDLRYEDGSIQWEAPSNRSGGQFRDSYDKRLQWWKTKAESIGISTHENQWISKTAKTIHPTKVRPCKKCGRYLDIRYCFLSANFIKRVKKLTYFRNTIELDYLTSIFDFVPQFIDQYKEKAIHDLPMLLCCKQVPDVPALNTLEEWKCWIENEYIVSGPSTLSPGAMANPPDRLDGFHSFNRCCRATADKGRSKENLALYNTDRRAFEHWVDGNWVTANMLMGLINSNPQIKVEHCLNGDDHPLPCSADHIGPVSLGFAHRPEFQLLCIPCNSAKNNRMFYTDILNLRRAESEGKIITTWYMEKIWRLLNGNVTDIESTLRLCRILRDNRHNAMMTLAEYAKAKHYLFLYTFLNLRYANFNYEIQEFNIDNHIVTADFERKPSELKYVQIQKARRVRIAFSSLNEYALKENRNGLRVSFDDNDSLFSRSIVALESAGIEYEKYNKMLGALLENEATTEVELRNFVSEVPMTPDISFIDNIDFARSCVMQIMDNIAHILAEMWDDSRYSRDMAD